MHANGPATLLEQHGAVVQNLRRPDKKGVNVPVKTRPAPLLFGNDRAAQVFYSIHQLVESAKML